MKLSKKLFKVTDRDKDNKYKKFKIFLLSFSVSEQAMEAWKRYIRRDDSHLVDLFVGQLKSTLHCTHCAHESVTFEPFWDLSLGIPSRSGEVSLSECLDAFTKEETLDGDEMPVNDKLNMNRN